MPTFSEIDITFATDFELGDVITLVINDNGVFSNYETTWVTSRSSAGEITVGTPTATPGERTAINYEVAFDLDNPTLFITTDTTNTINIQSETEGLLFVGIFESVTNVGTFSATYSNYYPPPDVSTIGFALTRSPHYINIPFEFETTTSAVIDLYIWSGDLTVVPGTPTYSFTQIRPSVDYEEFNVDISEVIREKLNPVPNIDTTLTTQVIDGSEDGAKWIKYIVTYVDDTNSIADIEGTFSAVDGFGYYSEGVNPTKPTDDVLTSAIYRKTERGQPILFPFTNDGTITNIDIDSGLIAANEVITPSAESTDFTQYICVDSSIEVADEYITITTHPAGDEYVYELVDECKYNPKTVYFKNRYGKYDQLTMFKKSSTKMTVEKKQFVNNYISAGTYDSTVHQIKDLNIQAKESIGLNSGYITEGENELYKQMLLSDKIFFYENDLFIPIRVTTKSIEYKTRVNDKLVKYSIDFEYAYNTIQNV